jgi:DNA-binding PadR family transcriptional regulator
MLELAILGLLQDQELHGYELKKRLGETLGPFSGASFGSLYPALRRLESAGAVKTVEARGPQVDRARSVPMTGSLGGELAAFAARRRATPAKSGRTRKVYGITQRGQQLFEELLATGGQASDDDRTFTLKLAFARYLPPEGRIHLLERRRAFLVERLAQARSSARARKDRLDLYNRSLIEHTSEITEHDISWLDQLLEIEARSTTSGQKGSPS